MTVTKWLADQILAGDVGYDLSPFAPDRFSSAAPTRARTREPIMGHQHGVELPEA